MRKFSKEVAAADVVINEAGQVTKAREGLNIISFCGEGTHIGKALEERAERRLLELRAGKINALEALKEVEKVAGFCVNIDIHLMEGETEESTEATTEARAMLAEIEQFVEKEALARYRRFTEALGDVENFRHGFSE